MEQQVIQANYEAVAGMLSQHNSKMRLALTYILGVADGSFEHAVKEMRRIAREALDFPEPNIHRLRETCAGCGRSTDDNQTITNLRTVLGHMAEKTLKKRRP